MLSARRSCCWGVVLMAALSFVCTDDLISAETEQKAAGDAKAAPPKKADAPTETFTEADKPRNVKIAARTCP